MVKKLSRNITVINIIAMSVVILVGGISIFLAKDILHNGYEIEEESKHIKIFDDLNTDAYRLVLSIHHFLIDPDQVYAREAISLVSKIESTTLGYRKMEEAEEYEESFEEVSILNELLRDIKELKKIVAVFDRYSKMGDFNRDELIGYEEFAYSLESSSKAINNIHFKKIEQWGQESIIKMWMILVLYLLFITFGGIAAQLIATNGFETRGLWL